MRKIAIIAAAVLSCSAASAADKKAPPPPLTTEQVKALVQVKDDSLETIATFNTLAAKKRYLWAAPEAQGFLRASLNKQTGETIFQVYSVVSYGREWRFYDRANFDVGSGAEQVDLVKIARDVGSCRYGCTYSEHVAFTIPEEQFRKIASMPADQKFRYRLKSKASIDSDVELDPGEFGGLLASVDEYRAKMPAPK